MFWRIGRQGELPWSTGKDRNVVWQNMFADSLEHSKMVLVLKPQCDRGKHFARYIHCIKK